MVNCITTPLVVRNYRYTVISKTINVNKVRTHLNQVYCSEIFVVSEISCFVISTLAQLGCWACSVWQLRVKYSLIQQLYFSRLVTSFVVTVFCSTKWYSNTNHTFEIESDSNNSRDRPFPLFEVRVSDIHVHSFTHWVHFHVVKCLLGVIMRFFFYYKNIKKLTSLHFHFQWNLK